MSQYILTAVCIIERLAKFQDRRRHLLVDLECVSLNSHPGLWVEECPWNTLSEIFVLQLTSVCLPRI